MPGSSPASGGAVVPVSAGSSPSEPPQAKEPPQAHEQAAIAIALPHVHCLRSIVRTAIGESAPNVNTDRDLSHRTESHEAKLSATSTPRDASRAHHSRAARLAQDRYDGVDPLDAPARRGARTKIR
jgi:hypothetical protein